MKPPAFQFYPGDWLSDANVELMTTEEVGIYWRLICHCWLLESLPENLDDLARLARTPRDSFVAAWETRIARCFRHADGGFSHPRLDVERKKQRKTRKERTKAANKRWCKGNANALQKQYDSVMQLVSSSSSSSSSSSEDKKEPPYPLKGAAGSLSPIAENGLAVQARQVTEVAIAYFNEKTGRKCEVTADRLKSIKRILSEGRTERDVKVVIWSKCAGPQKWLGDDKMDAHLTPETLFRRSHFQKYLEQAKREFSEGNPEQAKAFGWTGAEA